MVLFYSPGLTSKKTISVVNILEEPKRITMEKSKHHFHVSENARNVTIVAVVLIVAIIISYFEMKGRLGH